MATTSAFGWETPDDTDLVKDGAAAIRTLGNSIDTSMADLKGGTSGQVLSKASNTDMDFTWVAQDDSNAIQNAIVDAKGDLIAATAADTPARLAVGTNGQVLTADSTASTGLKWANASSGLTFISRTSFTNVASQTIDSIFTSTYNNYLVVIERIYAATPTDELRMQLRYGTTTQTSSTYNGNLVSTSRGTSTITNTTMFSQPHFTLGLSSGDSSESSAYEMTFTRVGNTSEGASWSGTGVLGNGYYGAAFFGAATHQSQTYTGILLKSASSNISGIVSVYGLAKS